MRMVFYLLFWTCPSWIHYQFGYHILVHVSEESPIWIDMDGGWQRIMTKNKWLFCMHVYSVCVVFGMLTSAKSFLFDTCTALNMGRDWRFGSCIVWYHRGGNRKSTLSRGLVAMIDPRPNAITHRIHVWYNYPEFQDWGWDMLGWPSLRCDLWPEITFHATCRTLRWTEISCTMHWELPLQIAPLTGRSYPASIK